MPGELRLLNETQAHRKGRFEQKLFNGVNLDNALSEIGDDELGAGTENVICFGKELWGRSGNAEAFSTTLPGSGTVYFCGYHKSTQKFFLHRGTGLYKAAQNMASWQEVYYDGTSTSFGYNEQSKIRALGPDLVVSSANVIVRVELSSASNDVIRKVNFSAPDTPMGSQSPGSGHKYRLIFTYLILSGTTTNGRITPGAVIEHESGTPNVTDPDLLDHGEVEVTNLIDKDNTATFHLNQSFTADAGTDLLTVTQAYNTGTRVRVKSDNTLPAGLSVNTDYYAIYVSATTMKLATSYANAIAGTNIDITDSGTGNHYVFANILNNVEAYHTHIGVYITGPLGADDINPETNLGYNREEYMWLTDIAVWTWNTAKSFVIDIDYDTWNGRALNKDYFLKTRKWAPLPSGNICAISGSFFLVASRDDEYLYYCQISDQGGKGVHLGYYIPRWQWMRFPEGIQEMQIFKKILTVWTNNGTYTIDLSSYSQVGDAYVLPGDPDEDNPEIGLTDWGSLAMVSESRCIAKFSDDTIRFWDGVSYSRDLSHRKVNSEVVQMLNGSLGCYSRGAYYLFYRKSSSDTKNTNCLRYAVEEKAGRGWAPITGTYFPWPTLNVGAITMVDANSIQRLIVLDSATGKFRWIETFTAYSGSSLSKVYQDNTNDVTAKIQFKEVKGSKFENNKIVEAFLIGVRPFSESVGYISGFEAVGKMFTDGATSPEETVNDVPYDGAIEFFKEHEGRRLAPYIEFNSTQMRVTEAALKYLEQNKKNIGDDITDTDEYTRQRNLAQNLLHRFCKPRMQVDKQDGALGTLTGTLTATTGPDGKTASAFQCAASGTTSIVVADNTSGAGLSGDCCLVFWVKNPPTGVNFFQMAAGDNTAFYLKFNSGTSLDLSGIDNLAIADVTDGEWHCLVLQRVSSIWTIYQNKTAKDTTDADTTTWGGGNVTIGGAMASAVFYDFILYSDDQATADLDYYYDDVVSHEGKSVMPYG